MSSVAPRLRSRKVQPVRAAIESLESRAYLSSGSPELLVTVPGPVPASAIAGAKVNANIQINIANDGTGPAKGKFGLTLFASTDAVLSNDDAQLVTETKGLNIAVGTNKNIKVKVHTLPQNLDGAYFILAQVSGSAPTVVGASSTTIVIAPPYVDLADVVTKVPTTAHLGKKFPVTVVVTNDGNIAAKGTLDTLFELSTSGTGADPIQVANLTKHINIKSGASKTLHLSVPVALGSPSGNQFVVAVVDPQNLFLDPNLANNTAVSVLPVSFS